MEVLRSEYGTSEDWDISYVVVSPRNDREASPMIPLGDLNKHNTDRCLNMEGGNLRALPICTEPQQLRDAENGDRVFPRDWPPN